MAKWQPAESADTDSTVFSWERSISERIRSGDSDAEAELVRRFEPGLRVLLRRRTGGDLGLMQDLVQETLLIVLQRLRKRALDDPTGLPAFTAQTCRNLVIAALRKRTRRRTDVSSQMAHDRAVYSPDLVKHAADHEAARAVRAMLVELPNLRDQLLLKRFYLEDQDKEAICAELELTEVAFNQALSRARVRFRTLVENRGLTKVDLLDPAVP